MNCDKCLHSGVCRYEDDARKFEESINKFTAEKARFVVDGAIKPECIEFIFKCSRFRIKYGSIRTPFTGVTPTTIDSTK